MLAIAGSEISQPANVDLQQPSGNADIVRRGGIERPDGATGIVLLKSDGAANRREIDELNKSIVWIILVELISEGVRLTEGTRQSERQGGAMTRWRSS